MTSMHAAPPIVNLLVIRSADIHRAVEFYRTMGMLFTLHAHGTGPEHYASEIAGFVFELYPRRNEKDDTKATRIGFSVDDVDGIIKMLRELRATIVSEPADSEWGRRAVVKDFDGHTVELITPPDREKKMDDAWRQRSKP